MFNSDTGMLFLAGQSALSSFRLEGLRQSLHALGVDLIDVTEVYLAYFSGSVEATRTSQLQTLLGGATVADPAAGVYVMPRVGTTSPWSSKATDIARVCGLDDLLRVEHGRYYRFDTELPGDSDQRESILALIHDRMTESVIDTISDLPAVFDEAAPRTLRHVPLMSQGRQALVDANQDWGLALSDDEIDYLAQSYAGLERDPTDAELMMFAQINSEHCRHKIFNADWEMDGEAQPHSLFDMIRLTYKASPQGVLSAYKDNCAVIEGHDAQRFVAADDHVYETHQEPVHILMKVETHNHPTAISPHPGAATGSGGEIRDEAATGRGGKPKGGLCGFSVSNLKIPAAPRPWEQDHGKPSHMASALDIMIEGPIGAAAYNNEFGRPNLTGYFRSMEMDVAGELHGYHKPIMIAGGMGNVRAEHVEKLPVTVGASLVVLGGPAMLIGLGGGAASSMQAGEGSAELDFASVQRANPEMERRCQEVVDRCWAMGHDNPILSIHDVGAGGLSNALPELVDADGIGAQFDLNAIPKADPSLSPMELWCNESQERYVLAIPPERMDQFAALCERERCPFAVVGQASTEPQLRLEDDSGNNKAVDLPMDMLLGKTPKMLRQGQRQKPLTTTLELETIEVADALVRVLQLPTVASKNFLITIGDRTVGGLVCRDQMVGPWQVPVADCAVTASGFTATTGEAMAMGERTPVALLDAPASGRMAVAEAVTNIAAAKIEKLSDIRLSANWMAAAGTAEEDARLFDTVRAVGAELCPELGIAIPVGKDSLSMRSLWKDDAGAEQRMTSPVSLIVSAFAPVSDIRQSLTPQLMLDSGETVLILIDLGRGQNRLGGSALAQVYGVTGEVPPDLDKHEDLKNFFSLIQSLNQAGDLLAYHDRSDGGVWATLCEMAFASRCGLEIDLVEQASTSSALSMLLSEELGAVIQVSAARETAILEQIEKQGLSAQTVARPVSGQDVTVRASGQSLFASDRIRLQRHWSETSYHIQALRDEPDCAQQEYDGLLDDSDPGLNVNLAFDPSDNIAAPYINTSKPRVAILREQGVNGQLEMAWSFHNAGFETVDVHMSDILSGRQSLQGFKGLAACGGFSYGDVLGAGTGWAQSILMNEQARSEFERFFNISSTFALGVCNGCQMMSQLKSLIPGADDWPSFLRNRSEQFEARLSLVEVMDSRSILLAGMAGSRLPIAVAHGEGRADFGDAPPSSAVLRYVEGSGETAERYPQNPNGSPLGLTGFTNADGRITIMMPHPERVTRTVQHSWHPKEWGEDAPWLRLFRNARAWVA